MQLKGREKPAECSTIGLNSNCSQKEKRHMKIWRAERSESHLSVSGSKKTSSLSSPEPAAPGTTSPGVDVLTMGTDWEAWSVVSDCATSEKTFTGTEDIFADVVVLSDSTPKFPPDLLIIYWRMCWVWWRTEGIKIKKKKNTALHIRLTDRDTWCCNL